jgi:hypothetical protein
MGMRHATEIATAITRRLLDFDHEQVLAHYAADNVRFVADDKAQLRKIFRIFLERCRVVGVQINEVETDASDDVIDSIITGEYDFLGEHYAHAKDRTTMCSTQKVVSKLTATWDAQAQAGSWSRGNNLVRAQF